MNHSNQIKIQEEISPADVLSIRELFLEYAASLEISLCFQDFERELAELPGKYAPPGGRLLLASAAGQPAGCVALRKLEGELCELKRLYVRPAWRRHGLGRTLAQKIIAAAGEIGYSFMRLDTLASMRPAISLYQSLGFRQILPYYENPSDSAVFMELAVNRQAQQPRLHPEQETL